MDVDLLKPGSIPISPDTVLGFEFLLDKNLLLNHLQKPNPDPCPTDLITKFYNVIAMTLKNRVEPEIIDHVTMDSNDIIKHPAKNIAMKILSLKVGAYLKWNLTQIRSLPFKTQINLLQDLMYFTSEDKTFMELTNIEQPDTKTASSQFLFALLLFHRWLLSTSMHRVTSNWQQRYGPNEMSLTDENIICCPENVKKTLNFLTDALQWEEIPCMLTFDCFKMPTEKNDTIEFDWGKATKVSKEEFYAQISYDLGTFFFYQENYESAKQYFSKCLQFTEAVSNQSGFLALDRETLAQYVGACDPTMNIQSKSLLEQLNNSIVNQFMGITNILQQDNLKKEIPLVHRINLELNIQGAVSSGIFTVARDLLLKVKALNQVRCVLERKFLCEFSLRVPKNVDTLLWAIQVNWKQHKEDDRGALKQFLLELVIKSDVPDLLNKIATNSLLQNVFDKAEYHYLTEGERKIPVVPESLFKSEGSLMEGPKKRKPKQEFKLFSRQLISTYNVQEIKELLTKIGMLNVGVSVWEINPKWELPIPLQSVIKGLAKGVLPDLAFILLAKSREQLQTKNWDLALQLLITLDQELQSSGSNVTKLSKMLKWEVLLIQITQLIEEHPKSGVDNTALANACESCLKTNDSVLPRTEIVESCAVCLLNLQRWDFLISYDTRLATFDIVAAIAFCCHEIGKNKALKRFSRSFEKNLWDLVLPVFASNQSKRGGNYHDVANLKANLTSIFLRLKDTWCLTIVISMLAKFFNIFKDETNVELQVDYLNLWPASVSNANSYNLAASSEMLSEVVSHALKDYPTNVPWLRLMGDINFANGNYEIGLSFYLKSLIICNDYFNIPVRYDDHVFRRMIKSCQALGCFTQAAVLCQFLEEPDYSLAFRILGEQKPCNDAVDAYYHCFWDTNILEFLIHLHNRRGEYQRRKCAIQVIGMLELNSNNNEEIQREASNLRKSVFLRALCKQYVF
ncbi:integrator complex subunit 8 [Anthonomus grandis grandis]|uniref:integrator complex subunit 8 n=1 Tax=Anthonomus grandis grandis TaxID=2921223 RepID=UPI0021663FF0|nr:integrator complex subunit 8 [Anthonomus grandis grandis]